MKKLKVTIRDWWRGYSDEDVKSLAEKLDRHFGAEPLKISLREWKAVRSLRINYSASKSIVHFGEIKK